MASNTKASGVTAENAVAAPAKAPVKYPLSRLRRDCRKLFGISTSTFDGATVGRKPDEEFTVAEMKEIVKTWQNAPIRPTKKEGK